MTPSFSEFCRKARQGNLIPVCREVLADRDTPVSAFLKMEGKPYRFLLESVEGGERWARYSFLGMNPMLMVRSHGPEAEVWESGQWRRVSLAGDPLDLVKELLSRYRPVPSSDLPRFWGGAVGYINYDVVRFLEKLPGTPQDDLGLPEIVFTVSDTLLIFDNVTHKLKVVALAFLDGSPLQEIYDRACDRIEEVITRLRKASVPDVAPASPASSLVLESSVSKEEFMESVLRAKEYIEAGDVIQVVLAQRLSSETSAPPFDIYRSLRSINPSPYMYFLDVGEFQVIGASPEVLVRLEDGWAEVRPIAGTRRRGATPREDERLEEELRGDPKERAEHIMLVDLGRNDLGRVSQAGTVAVVELMEVERFSHVMHLVSHVRSRLGSGHDEFGLLKACFPAGTVSGAPKVRAMEIIDELEPVRRGLYAGGVGYFGFSGNMEFCIAIRTILLIGRKAYVGVGAGIVADSNPLAEYEETMNKGKALIAALEMAASGLL